MRIQKLLSQRGVASRRKAEELVLAGHVLVNGAVCALGANVDPDKDTVTVCGKPLPGEQKAVYILLHKPRGFVTTLSDEKGRRNVAQLVEDCGVRVYPVGRLDYDSEGLLLMTNDGEFANRLMHPSHEVTKVYEVIVTGCSPEALERLERPVDLDGYIIKKPNVRLIKSGQRAVIHVTIHEGRNRQVRRMCAMAGMEVLRLKRIREGDLELGDLAVGKWRYLTDKEIDMLK